MSKGMGGEKERYGPHALNNHRVHEQARSEGRLPVDALVTRSFACSS